MINVETYYFCKNVGPENSKKLGVEGEFKKRKPFSPTPYSRAPWVRLVLENGKYVWIFIKVRF